MSSLDISEEALDDEGAWAEESNYVRRHMYEKKAVSVYNQIQKLNHESTNLQRAKGKLSTCILPLSFATIRIKGIDTDSIFAILHNSL